MLKTMLSLIGIVSMSLVCCFERAITQEIGESSTPFNISMIILVAHTQSDEQAHFSALVDALIAIECVI